MESKNMELTDLMNSLIEINNDRTEGYEKAIAQCKDKYPVLRSMFGELADESRDFTSVLKNKVFSLKGEPASGTTVSGKIHRVLMDVKWTFMGPDRNAILTSCAIGEEAAIKAYEQALTSDAEMGSTTRQMLISQKEGLQHSLERLNEEKITALAVVM